MKRQAKIIKLGIMFAMLLCIAILPVTMIEKVMAEEEVIEVIPFAMPGLEADKMPQVFFAHDKHVDAIFAAGKDCTACHTQDIFTFLDSAAQSEEDVIAYVHTECVSCHAATAAPTGPALASCRSCHI